MKVRQLFAMLKEQTAEGLDWRDTLQKQLESGHGVYTVDFRQKSRAFWQKHDSASRRAFRLVQRFQEIIAASLQEALGSNGEELESSEERLNWAWTEVSLSLELDAYSIQQGYDQIAEAIGQAWCQAGLPTWETDLGDDREETIIDSLLYDAEEFHPSANGTHRPSPFEA